MPTAYRTLVTSVVGLDQILFLFFNLLVLWKLPQSQELVQKLEVLFELAFCIGHGGVSRLLFSDSVEGNSVGQPCILQSEGQQDPVEDMVILIALLYQLFFEQTLEVVVVRRFLISHVTAILHVCEKFLRKSETQFFKGNFFHLL